MTSEGDQLEYDQLCICAGGSPKVISSQPGVLGIRDIGSIKVERLLFFSSSLVHSESENIEFG